MASIDLYVYGWTWVSNCRSTLWGKVHLFPVTSRHFVCMFGGNMIKLCNTDGGWKYAHMCGLLQPCPAHVVCYGVKECASLTGFMIHFLLYYILIFQFPLFTKDTMGARVCNAREATKKVLWIMPYNVQYVSDVIIMIIIMLLLPLLLL